MTKVGRNDPCPCGSGKKYKHCCFDTDRRARVTFEDFTTRQIRDLAEADPAVYFAAATAPQRVRQSFLEEIGNGLEGQAAAEAIERYVDTVEVEFASIASSRSRFWWIYLVRRLPPRPIGEDSPWTISLFRSTLWLGVLKYASRDGAVSATDHGRFNKLGGGLVLAELEPSEVTNLYTLEHLAWEFNAATVAYRRVGKGAVLRAENGDFSSPAEPTIEELIQLNDRRAGNFRIFSTWGSAADTMRDDDPHNWLVIAQMNASGETSPEALKPLGIRGKVNYLPAVMGLREIRRTLDVFDEPIKDLTGVSTNDILGFLWSVCTYQAEWSGRDVRAATQFTGRGYMASSREGIKISLERIAELFRAWRFAESGVEIDADSATTTVEQVHLALQMTDEDLDEVNLWDREPFPFVIPDDPYVIWDLASIPQFLRGLMKSVGRSDGVIANARGGHFETEVGSIARDAGLNVWEQSRVLKASADKKRDIDLGVLKGSTLYVVECKSFSASPRIDRGDFAALHDRWEALSGYLEQARTLASFIRSTPKGLNYEVPDSVTTIEHCLCTALPENIPSRDNRFWISEDLPRILTPPELVDWIKASPE